MYFIAAKLCRMPNINMFRGMFDAKCEFRDVLILSITFHRFWYVISVNELFSIRYKQILI